MEREEIIEKLRDYCYKHECDNKCKFYRNGGGCRLKDVYKAPDQSLEDWYSDIDGDDGLDYTLCKQVNDYDPGVPLWVIKLIYFAIGSAITSIIYNLLY